MKPLAETLKTTRLIIGIAMLVTFLVVRIRKPETRRHGPRPFVWVLLAILLLTFFNFYTEARQTDLLLDSHIIATAATYTLSVILQVDHLSYSEDPAWGTCLVCWAEMVVCDVSLFLEILHQPLLWTLCHIVFYTASLLRCCLVLSLLLPFIVDGVMGGRIMLRDEEEQDPPNDADGSITVADVKVLPDIRASGGILPWAKKFRIFLPWVLPRSVKTWCELAAVVSLILCETALSLYAPSLLGGFLDKLNEHRNVKELLAAAVQFAIAEFAVSSRGLPIFRAYIWEKFTAQRSCLLHKDIHSHIMRHEEAFHSKEDPTLLMTASLRGDAVFRAFDSMLLKILPNTAQLVGAIGTLDTLYGHTITLSAGYTATVVFILTFRIQKQQIPLEDDKRQAFITSERIKYGAIRGWKTVQQCGQVEREITRYAEARSDKQESELRVSRYSSLGKFTIGILEVVGDTTCLWLAVMRFLRGYATSGSVLAFQRYITLMTTPLGFFRDALKVLFQSLCQANELRRLLEIERTMDFGDEPIGNSDGNIEIKDVCVSRGRDSQIPVFNSLNLVIEAGKTTAIVGPSGSGKTTLLDLIRRCFDPQGGLVMIGGQDIRMLRRYELEKYTSYMGQDVTLFNGTIRANIAYTRPGASEEDIEKAAEDAGIHSDIMKMPMKYDTVLKVPDPALSGGQKQRIALARTLLQKSPILLCDEATSALDPITEKRVQQNLKSGRDRKTIVIVAHRFSSINGADNIVVLGQAGNVIESGKHSELVSRGGKYAEMWRNYIG